MALVAVLCVGSANAQLVKTRTNAPEAAKLDAASMAKVVAKTTPAPKGMVNVTLAAGDVWGDGSGYQMLLDADATEFGVTIPATGALYANCSAPATLYNVFEYKIPENADPVCTTSNIVYNNEITIQIPAGTYDYCIANPSPGDKIWIAGGASNNGRKDNFVFEDGKKYKFTVTLVGTGDDVALLIEDDMP
ncbi:DUF2436 domain-containing protein, partial [Bacteroidales bacterium OttesenSCG-928-J16]|nr:DUF2436 domain-containing protein [Bacteroidales bacterium OttesenSCG-928-J16]